MQTIWPQLATLLEQHTIRMRHTGPIDTRVDFNGQPQAVRLFRSDNGLGVVLLEDRPTTPDRGSQQQLMHRKILEQVRDAVIVTTAEPIDAPGPVIF